MKKASNRGRKPAAHAETSGKTTPPTVAALRSDDEMRPEYDFSGGVRGKYAARFAPSRPVRVVVLEPDVADAFWSARSINAALRRVLREREAKRAGRSRRPA